MPTLRSGLFVSSSTRSGRRYGGNLECVKAILETGASIKTKDRRKHTAYDWAMYIRKKTKSKKHGCCEAYLEDYKPALFVKRRR